MGRPLNKKFFGNAAGRIAGTGYFTGEAGDEAVYIVSQRSNSKYECESEAGPGTRNEVLTLVQGSPSEGEVQITVTPENAQTPAEMQVDFGTNGSGQVSSVTLVDGGYGYWADGNFNITVASDGGYVAGTEAQVDYTVSGGRVISVALNGGAPAGSGYSNSLAATTDVNTADLPDEAATPPVENARIINARQVKTFEGNTFDWPITAPLGAGDTGMTQADLDTQ